METPDIQEVNVQLGKQPVTNVRKMNILRRYVHQHLFLLLFQNMVAYNMITTIAMQLLHQQFLHLLINDTYKTEALIDSGCIDESFICTQICNLENSSIN